MTKKSYEAIVIGSGATGGVAALTLAQAGVKVLIVEAGPKWEVSQALGSEPCNTFKRFFNLFTGVHKKQAQHPGFWKANPLLYANEKENIYDHPIDRPFIWTRGKQVGGKSLTWGGITLRLSDYDLQASKTDGFGPTWPISYSDLSSHYLSLEKFLRIYGHKDGLDQLPDGEYIGSLPFTEIETHFINTIKYKLDYPIIHSRGFESHSSKDKNTWPRSSSIGSTLKAAISTGNVELLTEHIAERFIIQPNSNKAKGVIVVNQKNSERKQLNSNLIVLCASTINTIRILLSSESKNQENGFEDISGTLGTKLMDHISTCRFFSVPNLNNISNENNKESTKKLSGAGSFFIPFGNKASNYKDVNFIRGYGIWGGIDRFDPPNFLKKNPATKLGFLIGHGEVLPYENNKVTLSRNLDRWGLPIPFIDCKWGENELKMVTHMNSTIKKIIHTTGGEMLPLHKFINLPFLEKITNNSLATQLGPPPPGYYIHEVGGAAMGTSNQTSVVDKWNRLWNCKNVLVVDGACWPTSAWQSPTLTMMALTRRACLKAIQNKED